MEFELKSFHMSSADTAFNNMDSVLIINILKYSIIMYYI